MRALKLYIASSIDGYIARPDGDVKWLEDKDFMIPGEDFGYHEFLKTIDTTLMGGETYRIVLGFGIPWPYPDKVNYVFSRKDNPPDKNVSFVKDDIVGFVKNLKYQEGKDIWLVGGGQINTLLMDQGLVDEMIISVMPIILGKGIPMFTESDQSTKYKLASTKAYISGVIQLVYKL
ncbi:MAG: dihydrofolate reductase family protein [Bacteroidota bacterium]